MHPCDSWKEKKNNGPICVYSLGKGTVCEIYANKRYCFARKINLARFPSVYCKRRYLKANLLWMNRAKGFVAVCLFNVGLMSLYYTERLHLTARTRPPALDQDV